jgi:hypothetical protein
MVASLDAYPDQSSKVSFTAIIDPDPCLTVAWSYPIIQHMSGTVSATPVTQQITAFSTDPSCGSISYVVACTGSFMTFD